mgnify:CR=1 FL=1
MKKFLREVIFLLECSNSNFLFSTETRDILLAERCNLQNQKNKADERSNRTKKIYHFKH